MCILRFHGWRPGFNKIALSRAFTRHAGLSLGEAKRAVDQVLQGQSIDLQVASIEAGRELLREARESGADCRFVQIEGYDDEDIDLASSPEFWQMIRERRRNSKLIPLSEVEQRLGTDRET